MPFCNSCGTQNPDSAKFCAKCGTRLNDVSNENQASSAQPAESPIKPAARPVDSLPSKAPETEPTIPNTPVNAPTSAPGQTRFYMAAAGVSSGAKLKRALFFIAIFVIVGIALFLLVRFSIQKQKETQEALKQKAVKTMPLVPGTEPPVNTVDEDAKVDSNEAPSEATIKSENQAKETQPAKKTKRARKRTRKKRR